MVLANSFFASLLLLATAKPMAPHTMVVHESRVAPAEGFVQSAAAPAEQELTLRVALKQNNIAGLETELYKVSDPASECAFSASRCRFSLTILQSMGDI
jgi:tripeptidyl-peptidase-1